MNTKSVTLIYRQLKKASLYRFHQIHKKTAKQILTGLEASKGKTDKILIKQSDEYAKEVLGWHGFAPWLYVYCAVNNCFKEGWIPDNYFAKVVLPVINSEYGKVSELRSLSGHLFGRQMFPDLAYFVNGLFYSRDYRVLDEDELKELLFYNRDIVVFKTDKSLQGKGVFLFEKSSFDTRKIKIYGNGVFQYFIDQHPFFSEFMPSSVATIRITTYIEESGDVSVKASFLRIARSEQKNVMWASNIIIPISPISGELNEIGFFPNLHTTDSHPDTKITFVHKIIPFYDKCIITAVELHKQMPFDRCIGWDMIIDKDNNVKVMEWNGDHTDIKIHEAIQGPCFKGLGWEDLWKL